MPCVEIRVPGETVTSWFTDDVDSTEARLVVLAELIIVAAAVATAAAAVVAVVLVAVLVGVIEAAGRRLELVEELGTATLLLDGIADVLVNAADPISLTDDIAGWFACLLVGGHKVHW